MPSVSIVVNMRGTGAMDVKVSGRRSVLVSGNRQCLHQMHSGYLRVIVIWFLVATLARMSCAQVWGDVVFNGQNLDAIPALQLTAQRLQSRTEDEMVAVVSFRRAATAAQIADLARGGGSVIGYLPQHSYLVRGAPKHLAKFVGARDVVRLAELPPAAKFEPALEQRRLGMAPDAKIDIVILSVTAEPSNRLRLRGRATVKKSRRTPMGWFETRASVEAATLDDVSKMWSVFRIEDEPKYELHGERAAQTAAGNVVAGAVAPIGPGYAAWLAGKGLTGGSGLTIQVQDDGLDQGISTNAPGTAHPDLLGRIVGIFNATSDPLGDSADGHGQINAGIIAGNASVSATDGDGYRLGQGMAPQANVYATKIFRNGGAFNIGLETFSTLAKRAQDVGVRYSNNSWGSNSAGAYTTDSAEFDFLTRDADPFEPGNQPITYFFSAGNAGAGASTLGSPATAKNVIAVGAAENSDADGFDGCGVGPSGADNWRDIINFSSRGPTQDGRLGPTIVAVGTHVQGAASTHAAFNGSGVCDKYWPFGQTMYARSSGTSHSAPVAAGAALVVHEFFATQLSTLGHTSDPSPALMRAVLANTATDMVGGDDGAGGVIAHAPNTTQGWGNVNVGTLLDMKPNLFSVDQTEVLSSSGQSREFRLLPVVPGKPLKISLAWTDVPAIPGASATLVNDLDLEVVDAGITYRGNVISSGVSQAGGSPDRINTLEAVYLQNPSGGPVTVRVKAATLVGDGIPGIGGSVEQDFALFGWNAIDQSSRGWIAIEPISGGCSGARTVSVSDVDLRGAGTIFVQVTSGSDSESLQLSEQASSGVFVASIPVTQGADAPNSGVLRVSHLSQIVATYLDIDDGTGASATVVATASTDCVAPVVSQVAASPVLATTATINFSTNEPAAGAVVYGAQCAPSGLVGEATGASNDVSHSVLLSGLTPGTTYFYRARATDASGNVTLSENGASPCHTLLTQQSNEYFTELFDANDQDLANYSVLLTPDGSGDFYEACQRPASSFSTDPSGGTPLALSDDGFLPITLSGGAAVSIYGVSYSTLFVGSNGYVTFGSGDVNLAESIESHFQYARVAGLYDDLNPSAGGSVSWKQLADRVAITWQDVPEFLSSNSNSFQIELFFDGRIRITRLGIAAQDGLVGISAGAGVPFGFAESNLNTYSPCGGDAQNSFHTELFDTNDVDLSNLSLSFVPDGTPNFYSQCRTSATAFPTDPAGGTPLLLGDDTSLPVTLQGGATVSLYGVPHSSFFVSSNGYVTLDAPDAQFNESITAHFASPRIAALFDDLNPGAGGAVSWKQLVDRVAITWQSVPQFNVADANSFQIELFFDGRIRVTYLDIAATDGLAGLSAGAGVPVAFVESDLSTSQLCATTSITISGRVTDPFGGLAGVTLTGLQQVQTDADGFYSAEVSLPFDGSVTPAKFGYTFLPQLRQYPGVSIDQSEQDFQASLDPGVPQASFDFETNSSGFVLDNGFGAGGGLWHQTQACASTSGAHSTPGSLFFGVDATCNFDSGASEGAILSPQFVVSPGQLELEFRYFLHTERAVAPSRDPRPQVAIYDIAEVAISVDDGAFLTVAVNDPDLPLQQLVDGSGKWQQAVIDLSPFVAAGTTSNVRVRFSFRTGDAIANQFPGFYVDDVVVRASGGLTASEPQDVKQVPLGQWVQVALALLLIVIHQLRYQNGSKKYRKPPDARS